MRGGMAAPIRVLEVVTVPFGQNGISRCVQNLIGGFDPARVRCDLAALSPASASARTAVHALGGETFALDERNRNPFSYMARLQKIVSARRIEIVHAHGNSATLYAEMRAAKKGGAHVRISHSHNTTCKMKLVDALLRRPFDRSYTQAMACGTDAGLWLFGDRPFTVLNNAIDTERFCFDAQKRAAMRESLRLSPDAPALCQVGTFNAQKNHIFWAEALPALLKERADAVLLLVGDGPLFAETKALFAARGLSERVRFVGCSEDVTPYLCAADAFCLPSRFEGLPLTLIEAQCAGLPCFASEFVTREADLTGNVAFLPLTADEWAKSLALVAASDDRAAKSHAAIADVAAAGYDRKQNAERLMSLYESYVEAARV